MPYKKFSCKTVQSRCLVKVFKKKIQNFQIIMDERKCFYSINMDDTFLLGNMTTACL